MSAPIGGPFRDVGNLACSLLLTTIADTLDECGLERPAVFTELAGTGPSIIDACDGLIWVRVGAVYPTDGSGEPFVQARIGWDVPAWCYPIEIGVLWCHANIDEDGGYIDPDLEAGFAARDDQYRLAITSAVANGFPDAVRADPDATAAIAGQSILGWTPAGPDGGYSGGIFVTRIVALALCVPNEGGG